MQWLILRIADTLSVIKDADESAWDLSGDYVPLNFDLDAIFFDWIVDVEVRVVRAIELHIPIKAFAASCPDLVNREFITDRDGFPSIWLTALRSGINLNAEEWDIEFFRHRTSFDYLMKIRAFGIDDFLVDISC